MKGPQTILFEFLTASLVSTSGLRNNFVVVVGVVLGYYAKKVQNNIESGKMLQKRKQDVTRCNKM